MENTVVEPGTSVLTAIIIWIVVGAIAGWLAGMVVKGGGFGFVGNAVLGIIGAVVAGWLFKALGIAVVSYDGRLCFGLLADYDALPDVDVLATQLREAIADDATARKGFPVTPDRVFVTVGGKGVMLYAILGLIDPGD